MKKTTIGLIIGVFLIAVASAIYQGETESVYKSEFTTIDSYEVIENTSAISVSINGTNVSYTIPEDYLPGTFRIRLYGWADEKPIVSEIKSGGDGGCITTWKCSEWSSCSPNSTQTRTCTKEKNYCYAKPTNLTQKCTYTPTAPPAPTPPVIKLPIADPPSSSQWVVYIILVGGIIIVSIIIIIYYWMGSKV